MRKKILEIIIVCLALTFCLDRAVQWGKMQDKNLLRLQQVKLPPAEEQPIITARKPHASFYLGMKMLKMPDDVEGKDFLVWCKQNNVDYILWSHVEAQTRPKLASGEWTKGIEVVWNLKGWGFLGRVK